MSKQREILVVLDLNGNLICRLKTSIEKRGLMQTGWAKEHDFGVNKAKVYIREHFDKLMNTLTLNNTMQYAVWTSAGPKNAAKIVQNLFGNCLKQPLFVLDRSHCTNAPQGVRSTNLRKDLNVIFNSKKLSKKNRWTETNTLLVDDSPSKAKTHPQNLYVVPTFNVLEKDPASDNTLEVLADWLQHLADSSEYHDVRDAIKCRNELMLE